LKFRSFLETSLDIKFGEQIIERTDKLTILGLTIDEQLSFRPHIEQLSKKVVALMFAIKRIRNVIPHETAILLYHAHINSRLLYMANIWSIAAKSVMDKLEIIQRKALRIIFKKDWHCSKKELYSMKFLPVSANAQLTTLIFAHKMAHNMVKNNVEIGNNFDVHGRDTRYKNNFVLPRYKYVASMQNLFYRSMSSYNNLPLTIRSYHSLSVFKNKAREYLFNQVVMRNYLN
jgi:hypothetical protein